MPDMVRALSHIRATGTFPVSSRLPPSSSSSPTTSRADHGCGFPAALPRRHHRHPPPTSPPPLTTPSPPQPDVDSKEDQNSVGPCPVSDAKIASLRARVEAWLRPGQPGHAILGGAGGARRRLCLLDGFLLYSASVAPVTDAIDVRLFLLASRAAATRRRAARDGYVTLEGFWRDPPGYVDRVVWPNYEAAHAWLFEGGDVQGEPRRDVLARERIRVQLGKGLDVDMETTLEWAVDTIMGDLEAFVGS